MPLGNRLAAEFFGTMWLVLGGGAAVQYLPPLFRD